jgi:hypothetical protein
MWAICEAGMLTLDMPWIRGQQHPAGSEFLIELDGLMRIVSVAHHHFTLARALQG